MTCNLKTALCGAMVLAAVSGAAPYTTVPAHAADQKGMTMPAAASKGPITVTGAWARPTIAKMKISAAYFAATIADGATDTLIAAKTPVADKAELHQHIMQGDVAKMRPVDAVPLSADHPVVFQPGGYHIMIMGVKNPPLREGTTFPLTLTFEKAGDVTVTVNVSKMGSGMSHGTMDHGKMDHGQHK